MRKAEVHRTSDLTEWNHSQRMAKRQRTPSPVSQQLYGTSYRCQLELALPRALPFRAYELYFGCGNTRRALWRTRSKPFRKLPRLIKGGFRAFFACGIPT